MGEIKSVLSPSTLEEVPITVRLAGTQGDRGLAFL